MNMSAPNGNDRRWQGHLNAVIAEKFQSMVALGRANSRMKDIYAIWILSRSFDFEGRRLSQAIAATFAWRATTIPIEPRDVLSADFAADGQKKSTMPGLC
jgi:hypothetical protein